MYRMIGSMKRIIKNHYPTLLNTKKNMTLLK